MELTWNSHPQQQFLESTADIVIFGGQAGGGKTMCLLLEAGRHVNVPGFVAAFFRRTKPEIKRPGGPWPESIKIYAGMGARPNMVDLSWRFPGGGRVEFHHLQREYDTTAWLGAQVPLLIFDQLETFTENQFFEMMARNRSMCGVVPYVRASCNPDPDCFLYKNGDEQGLISWWIDRDTGLPIPERSGVVRWFVRRDEKLHWADSAEELRAQFPSESKAEFQPKSITFIPASVYDNVDLMRANPEYLSNLMALPRVQRMRMLGGNWKVRASAGNVFKREWFLGKVVNAVPTDLVKQIRAWDLAATVATGGNDPDWCCSFRVGMKADKTIWIFNRVKRRGTPAEIENLIEATARQQDGVIVPGLLEQEGGSAGKGWPDMMIRTRLQGLTYRYQKPQGNKIDRASPLSAQAEVGNVYLVDGPWIDDFLNELENFPDGSHDDQVDAASSGYNYLVQSGILEPFSTPNAPASDYSHIEAAPRGVFGSARSPWSEEDE